MNSTIDFKAINAAARASYRALLPELLPGGKFRGPEYVCTNPRRDDRSPGSFKINFVKNGVWKDFASGEGGSDFISLVSHVRSCSQGDAARRLAERLQVPLHSGSKSSNGAAPPSTPRAPKPIMHGATPKIHQWSDPPHFPDEARRHEYRRDGGAVRVKIKRRDGSFVNWYRVGADQWLPKKPDDYRAVPYCTAAMDPFDPELIGDEILWPEGERDVDTLDKINLPAFTFGGAGDGLPDGISDYLKDRRLVILADNDDPGREHAEKKAELAHAAGAALIKVVHFPELPPKADVSDFLAGDGTAQQLQALIDAVSLWEPQEMPAPPTANQHKADNAGPSLISRCAAEIPPESVEWLWYGRFARGKHTCIAGEPGTGKSQLTIAIIAGVTTGGSWPCGEGEAPIGNVVILSAEDGVADTIIPRLMAAGADLNRVEIISAVRNPDESRRSFNLQCDLALLENKIKAIGDVALVVIDPVSSYLGKTDSHKNSEVRGVLEPLTEMADRTRVAVLSVTHFSKTASNNTIKALHRFIGSIAFTGAPRAAFAVIEDAENEGRRLFLHAKNNLAAPPQGLAFRLEPRVKALRRVLCGRPPRSLLQPMRP
jgi:KaiC/GvpD/RAD55 family RecA-like ATPase